MRYIPDKYLALGVWGILVCLYLKTKDDAIRYMMFSIFGVVIMAFKDGLNRIYESFKNKLKANENKEYGSKEKDNQSEDKQSL